MPDAFSAVPVILTGFGLVLFWMNGASGRCHRICFSITFLLAYVYNTAFFVIDAMTGQGVDDSFFYHLEHGIEGAGTGQYKGIIIAAVVAVLVGMALAWATYKYSPRAKKDDQRKQQSQIRQLMPVVAIMCSFSIHPFTFALQQQYSLSVLSKTVGYVPCDDMDDWEPSPAFQDAYRDPRDIHDLNPTKNIIHIYMESLERNYFDENEFPGVASRLRRWEERAVSFTNIDRAGGTGYTVAALVSSMCGIPLITTGGSGNSMQGLEEFLPGATCLSDLLKEAGYHQTFVGGADLAFAGKGDFLKSHGFDNLLGKKELMAEHPKAEVTGWGIQDDVLLDVVFDKYKELSADEEKPFALYALTLDTHGSHPSSRCIEDKVVTGDGTIVDSVRCTDYLVDQFLQRVLDEDSKRGKNNTLIILSSDHLAMGYANTGKLSHSGPRRNAFFVLENGKSEIKNMVGTMMDVPATILSFLGYPGKAFGFGRDLMTRESLISQDPGFGNNVLKKYEKDIRRKFWMMPSIRNSGNMEVDIKKHLMRLGGRVYSIPFLISANSQGIIEEIFLLDDTNDKTPIAYRDHSGTTITVDNCKYFESQLAGKNSNYCLFVKDQASSDGWIRLLKKAGHASVDLNAVLHMTQPKGGFFHAALKNNTKAAR